MRAFGCSEWYIYSISRPPNSKNTTLIHNWMNAEFFLFWQCTRICHPVRKHKRYIYIVVAVVHVLCVNGVGCIQIIIRIVVVWRKRWVMTRANFQDRISMCCAVDVANQCQFLRDWVQCKAYAKGLCCTDGVSHIWIAVFMTCSLVPRSEM